MCGWRKNGCLLSIMWNFGQLKIRLVNQQTNFEHTDWLKLISPKPNTINSCHSQSCSELNKYKCNYFTYKQSNSIMLDSCNYIKFVCLIQSLFLIRMCMSTFQNVVSLNMIHFLIKFVLNSVINKNYNHAC